MLECLNSNTCRASLSSSSPPSSKVFAANDNRYKKELVAYGSDQMWKMMKLTRLCCKYIIMSLLVTGTVVEGRTAGMLFKPHFLRTEIGAPELAAVADSNGVASAEPVPEVAAPDQTQYQPLPVATTYQSRPPGQEVALPLSLGSYIRNFVVGGLCYVRNFVVSNFLLTFPVPSQYQSPDRPQGVATTYQQIQQPQQPQQTQKPVEVVDYAGVDEHGQVTLLRQICYE
ncbi:hypothetical protein ACFFRR_011047 [Megaselia abdita]